MGNVGVGGKLHISRVPVLSPYFVSSQSPDDCELAFEDSLSLG